MRNTTLDLPSFTSTSCCGNRRKSNDGGDRAKRVLWKQQGDFQHDDREPLVLTVVQHRHKFITMLKTSNHYRIDLILDRVKSTSKDKAVAAC